MRLLVGVEEKDMTLFERIWLCGRLNGDLKEELKLKEELRQLIFDTLQKGVERGLDKKKTPEGNFLATCKVMNEAYAKAVGVERDIDELKKGE